MGVLGRVLVAASPSLAFKCKPFHFTPSASPLPLSFSSLQGRLCVRFLSQYNPPDSPALTSPPHHHHHRKLILYSKPGCCLCDNLKEKLHTVFLLGGQDSLADVQLEVRDITTKAEWEAAYQYEIPVLARVNEDDSETVLPRLSPRLSIELMHKKLSAVFS